MDAPSAMLSKPMIGQNVVAGLGTAPMVTGNIPIHPGATNPEAAGILAPKATGVSPGSVEGAQAELASLQGGKPAWSGQGYQDLRTKQLQDFLAANSSQGGLVGPQGGGPFARGGMAEVYRARHSTLGRPVAIKLLADMNAPLDGRIRFNPPPIHISGDPLARAVEVIGR